MMQKTLKNGYEPIRRKHWIPTRSGCPYPVDIIGNIKKDTEQALNVQHPMSEPACYFLLQGIEKTISKEIKLEKVPSLWLYFRQSSRTYKDWTYGNTANQNRQKATQWHHTADKLTSILVESTWKTTKNSYSRLLNITNLYHN